MTTFAALATAFTSALAADFCDQLDSVFDYFWSADDVIQYFLRKLFSRRKTNLHENIFIKSPGVDE